MKTLLNLLFIFSFTISLANENPKLKEYRNFLLSLNPNKFYSTSFAVNKCKELFNSEKIEVKDSAFVIFDKFYDDVQKNLNELHQNDETDYLVLFYDEKNGEKIKVPDIILNYKKDLIENGFDIAISEGSTYIKKDRNFISKNFYDFISPTMKQYCTFLNTVVKEETEKDGALTISPTRLAERIIWLENFTELNPNFQLNDKCKGYYKYFLFLLLNGSDHSAILDERDFVNQNFALAYDFITLENSNSKTSKLVLPFYQFLKNKQKSKAYDLLEKYQNDKIIEY
jgi:hypothetical protein